MKAYQLSQSWALDGHVKRLSKFRPYHKRTLPVARRLSSGCKQDVCSKSEMFVGVPCNSGWVWLNIQQYKWDGMHVIDRSICQWLGTHIKRNTCSSDILVLLVSIYFLCYQWHVFFLVSEQGHVWLWRQCTATHLKMEETNAIFWQNSKGCSQIWHIPATGRPAQPCPSRTKIFLALAQAFSTLANVVGHTSQTAREQEALWTMTGALSLGRSSHFSLIKQRDKLLDDIVQIQLLYFHL